MSRPFSVEILSTAALMYENSILKDSKDLKELLKSQDRLNWRDSNSICHMISFHINGL